MSFTQKHPLLPHIYRCAKSDGCWVIRQWSALHTSRTLINSSVKYALPWESTRWVKNKAFDEVTHCTLSYLLTALYLASYESEGPENNMEKDRWKSLRYVSASIQSSHVNNCSWYLLGLLCSGQTFGCDFYMLISCLCINHSAVMTL